MTAPVNQSNFTKYQPFIKWVGGGAMFFELYSLELLKNKNVYLFDINSKLINAYNVVKNNPTELIKNLNKTYFNGLYRVNKRNQYNIPIRNYKNSNISDSEAIFNANLILYYPNNNLKVA